MLDINTLNFLRELKENNNREWFAENKNRYETAKADLEGLVAQLLPGMNEIDPSVTFPEPKKTIFRIYRDTRFSANKEPYKTNMGAALGPEEARRSWDYSMYYLHVEPDKCFISSGLYMPPPPVLKAIRTAIYEDFDDFSELIGNTAFKSMLGELAKDEDTLKRVPNGFDKDHPAAEYLKLKHFYVFKNFTDKQVCSKDFIKKALECIAVMKPFNQWLNNVVADIES